MIDRNEAPSGCFAAPRVSFEKPCRDCFFIAPGRTCIRRDDAMCCAVDRKDGEHVIFREIVKGDG